MSTGHHRSMADVWGERAFNLKLREWEGYYWLGGQTPYERLLQKTKAQLVTGHRPPSTATFHRQFKRLKTALLGKTHRCCSHGITHLVGNCGQNVGTGALFRSDPR
jgi:hypothetical protein